MTRRGLVLLLLTGCAGLGVGDSFDPLPRAGSSADADADAGSGAAPLAVEIGTGATEFVPLHVADRVEVIAGPQGGFHLWTSVRVHDKAVEQARIGLSVRFADGGAPAGPPFSVTLPLTATGDAGEHVGMTNFVDSPSAVRGVHVIMHVDVTTKNGRTGSDEREVVPF